MARSRSEHVLQASGWGPFRLPGERKRMERLTKKYEDIFDDIEQRAEQAASAPPGGAPVTTSPPVAPPGPQRSESPDTERNSLEKRVESLRPTAPRDNREPAFWNSIFQALIEPQAMSVNRLLDQYRAKMEVVDPDLWIVAHNSVSSIAQLKTNDLMFNDCLRAARAIDRADSLCMKVMRIRSEDGLRALRGQILRHSENLLQPTTDATRTMEQWLIQNKSS